jgi:hypothetical protein
VVEREEMRLKSIDGTFKLSGQRNMRRFSSAFNRFLILSLLGATSAIAQTPRSQADADISEIGHRNISRGPFLYSAEREQEMGNELASYLERYNKFITDPGIIAYVDTIAKVVEQNSDKHRRIAIKLIDSNKAESFTLPGHLYITKGLLLRLENEGGLASAIARGVAHEALRSDAKACGYEAEFDADYFGIQYLYKAGYAPQCFLDFVGLAGDIQQTFLADIDSGCPPLPPKAQRLRLLQKEIAEILPSRDGAIVSTAEFRKFKDRIAARNSEIVSPEGTKKSN